MALPPQLIDQLEAEKRLLEDKIFEQQVRIKEITELLNHAQKLNINWAAKAISCLRGTLEPMTMDDILRCIFQGDLTELDNKDRRRNYVLQLSLALNRLCNKGTIIGNNINGYKGKIYFLKEWAQENGSFKTEYKYYYDRKINRLLTEKNRMQFG